MAVFWVVASCSLVEVFRRFRGACCLHRQGDEWHWFIVLMMEAANTSETSENVYQDYTTQQPRRQPPSSSPPWEPEISTLDLLFNKMFTISIRWHWIITYLQRARDSRLCNSETLLLTCLRNVPETACPDCLKAPWIRPLLCPSKSLTRPYSLFTIMSHL
jgi:hypothetical protein